MWDRSGVGCFFDNDVNWFQSASKSLGSEVQSASVQQVEDVRLAVFRESPLSLRMIMVHFGLQKQSCACPTRPNHWV